MEDRNIEDTRQPPDEPEAQFCEDCGEEMEYHFGNEETWDDSYFKCNNKFCPSKIEIGANPKVVIAMARYLVEVEQDLRDAKADLKYAEARITNLVVLVNRYRGTEFDNLTRSQHG